MSAINLQLTFGLAWIVGCALLFFWLLYRSDRSLPSVALAFVAALVARLIPAIAVPRCAGYEMAVFQQAAALTRAGESVYRSQIAHPYLPFQIYWMAAADWLAERTTQSFVFWLKVDSILADAALVLLIALAVRQLAGNRSARQASWLYAFNPITILVTAYQGQFDAIPLLFMLVAWYAFAFGKGRLALAGSAVALGFAMLSKTWPVLLLPVLLLRLPRWRTRLVYALLAAVVPLLGLLFFAALYPGSLVPMVRRALRAGAISGWWGYSSVLNVAVQLGYLGRESFLLLSDWGKNLTFLAGFITIWLTRRRPALRSILLAILVLFAAVPNLGVQGLLWVIALALIAGRRDEAGWYVAAGFVHMVVSYWGLHLSDGLIYRLLPELMANATIQLSSLIPWLVIVLWAVQELAGTSLIPPIFTSRIVGEEPSPAETARPY